MQLAPGTSWAQTFERARLATPEAFSSDRILNLIQGEWIDNGQGGQHVSPLDGTLIPGPPRIDHPAAERAVAGNAVIAKTLSQGGFHCLTLAHALMRRAGLPVTLVSGVGSQLGDVLIRGEGLGALAFVGGRANGRKAATSLADTGRRHFWSRRV